MHDLQHDHYSRWSPTKIVFWLDELKNRTINTSFSYTLRHLLTGEVIMYWGRWFFPRLSRRWCEKQLSFTNWKRKFSKKSQLWLGLLKYSSDNFLLILRKFYFLLVKKLEGLLAMKSLVLHPFWQTKRPLLATPPFPESQIGRKYSWSMLSLGSKQRSIASQIVPLRQ